MKAKYRKLLENPVSLKVIAVLCVLQAVSSSVEMVLRLIQGGGLVLNVGLLGFLAGPGLLRHQRGWRTSVSVYSGFVLFSCSTVLLLLADQTFGGGNYFVAESSFDPELRQVQASFNPAAGSLNPYITLPAWALEHSRWALATFAGLALLQCWIFHILFRADIRTLFDRQPDLALRADEE